MILLLLLSQPITIAVHGEAGADGEGYAVMGTAVDAAYCFDTLCLGAIAHFGRTAGSHVARHDVSLTVGPSLQVQGDAWSLEAGMGVGARWTHTVALARLASSVPSSEWPFASREGGDTLTAMELHIALGRALGAGFSIDVMASTQIMPEGGTALIVHEIYQSSAVVARIGIGVRWRS